MVTYQIYPLSFQDSNADGRGDLSGIAQRLDYVKALGVDAIWISPFFRSPMRDFGYDVSDYRDVDPVFGTMEDFRALKRAADARRLKVLLDFVASHTSDRHAWFQRSVQRDPGVADWYLWADAKADGSPPNNWLSVFGGSAWQWHPVRRQYYYHTFLTTQPDLNLHNPAVQEQILSDMEFWLREGVAGFRLDACNHYFQDIALRDNPPRPEARSALHPYGFQTHVYDQGRPEALPFFEKMRCLLDRYGAFSLAEVGGTDAIALMGDYTQPGRLHSAYSFSLMGPDGSAAQIRRIVDRLQSTLHRSALACYAFSNHDKPRVVSRWLDGRDPVATAKQMLALLLCLPGHVCLYQGEELGLPQADVPFERLQDPYGKTFWPAFKGRDGCRTPMPWSAATHGGFSAVEPWLPMSAEHLALNAAAQERDANSTLAAAKALVNLRREHVVLSGRELTWMEGLGDDVLAFRRGVGEQALVCVFNLSKAPMKIAIGLNGAPLFTLNAAVERDAMRLGVNGCVIGRV